MPATRARGAAAERQFLELPADVLGLVLYQLPLAHDIALAGRTCRALCDAGEALAFKARPFSSDVVTLAGHTSHVWNVATAADDHIITGAFDNTVKIWRDGACVRTIQAHAEAVRGVAVVLGGTRFVSGSIDHTVKLWTFDGDLERTLRLGGPVFCVMALPDGEHFVVGLAEETAARPPVPRRRDARPSLQGPRRLSSEVGSRRFRWR